MKKRWLLTAALLSSPFALFSPFASAAMAHEYRYQRVVRWRAAIHVRLATPERQRVRGRADTDHVWSRPHDDGRRHRGSFVRRRTLTIYRVDAWR